MNIVRGVKERREQRIRAIVERNSSVSADAVPGAAVLQPALQGEDGMRGEHPHPSLRGDAEKAKRELLPAAASPSGGRTAGEEPDPETEWKRKSQEWLAAGTPPRSAWLAPDEPAAPPRQARGGLHGLLVRLGFAALLFVVVWGVFRLDEPWAVPVKQHIVSVLTEDMDTHAIAAWYGETFSGAPSFIPIFRQEDSEGATRASGSAEASIVAPISAGQVVRTFAETLSGIDIAGRPSAAVVSIETGRVTHVSGSEQEGYSIVIQHANKRSTIYGRLQSASVQPNDWVEAGDRIGALPPSADGSSRLLYFAVRIDGSYVDPTDVVPLD